MSETARDVRPRRRRVMTIVAVITLLLTTAAGGMWWLSYPRGPIAEHLKNHTWRVEAGQLPPSKIHFYADGRLMTAVPQGHVHSRWSVRNGQVVISGPSRSTTLLHRLFGKTPTEASYDVIEMSEETVLLRIEVFGGQPVRLDMKLTRIAE